LTGVHILGDGQGDAGQVGRADELEFIILTGVDIGVDPAEVDVVVAGVKGRCVIIIRANSPIVIWLRCHCCENSASVGMVGMSIPRLQQSG
jgi:hypothetical protein